MTHGHICMYDRIYELWLILANNPTKIFYITEPLITLENLNLRHMKHRWEKENGNNQMKTWFARSMNYGSSKVTATKWKQLSLLDAVITATTGSTRSKGSSNTAPFWKRKKKKKKSSTILLLTLLLNLEKSVKSWTKCLINQDPESVAHQI